MKLNLYRKWSIRETIQNLKSSMMRHAKNAALKSTILNFTTETEVMDEAGYIRIYDAGQMKWVKNM